jgi:hypothetical protein
MVELATEQRQENRSKMPKLLTWSETTGCVAQRSSWTAVTLCLSQLRKLACWPARWIRATAFLERL